MGDFYILKPTVHSRTTVTRGDSLVAFEFAQMLKAGIDPWKNDPLGWPDLYKNHYDRFEIPLPEAWHPTAWRDQFLTLDAVDLIAPKGVHPIENDLVNHFLFNNDYLEAHVWGSLQPTHIHAFAMDRFGSDLDADLIATYRAAGIQLYFKHEEGTFLRVSDYWPTIEKNIKMGQDYDDAVRNAFKIAPLRPLSILEI